MTSKYLQMALRTSPHITRGVGVEVIMRNVVYALLSTISASARCCWYWSALFRQSPLNMGPRDLPANPIRSAIVRLSLRACCWV